MRTLAVILILCALCPAAKAESKSTKSKVYSKIELRALVPKLDVLPPPKTLEAKIEQNVALRIPTNKLGFAQQADPKKQVKIVYVAPNSAAYWHGLQTGDRILAEDVTKDRTTIIIERNRKLFACTFNLQAKTDETTTDKNNSVLEGRIALANNQLILLIDCSASMRTKDCAGEISRWEWCRRNTKKLYERCLRDCADDAKIITFDSRYQTHRDGLYGKLDKIFANDLPDGETFMAPPLSEAFSLVKDSLNKNRPAIIAVITDGRPSDAKEVKAAIIEQANALKQPDLLSISFIEVGSPEYFLYDLDNNLTGQGAHADIVSVTGFYTVNWKGLEGTLTEIALQAQKARLDKEAAQKRALHSSAYAQSSQAKEAADKAAADKAVADKAAADKAAADRAAADQAANRTYPTGNRVPPVKAHPSGTPAEGQAAPKKVVEVDEKETVRRESANRTYNLKK